MSIPLFHLAFPVDDLDAARAFYSGLLGCTEGRSDELWVDFDFFGHQLVAHMGTSPSSVPDSNPVDGHDVPVPHFGVILEWEVWKRLSERLLQADVEFIIAPGIRFEGQPGEQATMFMCDPAGNALEFKSFKDPSQVFAV